MAEIKRRTQGINGSQRIEYVYSYDVTLTGATVTITGAVPANSVFLGVTGKVLTAITGATSFDVGDGTTADLYGDDLALTVGTQINDSTMKSGSTIPKFLKTAGSVVLTANDRDFTAGKVRISTHYYKFRC